MEIAFWIKYQKNLSKLTDLKALNYLDLFGEKEKNIIAYIINKYPNLRPRLYFGHESCEKQLPSLAEFKKIIKALSKTTLPITWVIPYLGPDKFNTVLEIFEYLANNNTLLEVAANDYGVLYALKNYPNLDPVLGRLLNKMKRIPRLAYDSDLAKIEKEYFSTSNCNDPNYQKFLIDLGIKRIEWDLSPVGLHLLKSNNDINYSIHYPYAYITSGRVCPFTSIGTPEKTEESLKIMAACKKACEKYHQNWTSENPLAAEDIIVKGNAVYYKIDISEKKMIKLFDKPQLNRLVIPID